MVCLPAFQAWSHRHRRPASAGMPCDTRNKRVDDADRPSGCRSVQRVTSTQKLPTVQHRGPRKSPGSGPTASTMPGRSRQEVLVQSNPASAPDRTACFRRRSSCQLVLVMKEIAVLKDRILGNRGLSGWIERQEGLKAHHAVDDQEAADMKQQHRDRVGQPMLLAAARRRRRSSRCQASTGRSTGDRNVRSPLKTRVIYQPSGLPARRRWRSRE